MTHLKTGDIAPPFTAYDQDGNKTSLNDFRGHKVILYFYPKANTPGCTAESCNLRDHYDFFLKQGFKVIGISADAPQKQQNFKTKFELPFPLIADENKEVIKAYGVWGEKKMYGKVYEGIHRMTFVIDEEGKIQHIFKKVKTKTHAEQIIKELQLNE
jgi:peroxiredoxin Q/BCP